jgi:hypothetical protein
VFLSDVPYTFQEHVVIVCDFGSSDIEKITDKFMIAHYFVVSNEVTEIVKMRW